MFTSGDDGKIGINATSGDLEVGIIDATENPQSLVGKALNFETKDGVVLFEPGAVYHTEGFRVSNLGDIPMNYIVYISKDKDVTADFSAAFEVWITTNPATREMDEKLQEFEGSLAPEKSSEIYYLVFRMKETAGNEFQDRTFTGVGITVCAVQGDYYVNRKHKTHPWYYIQGNRRNYHGGNAVYGSFYDNFNACFR